MTPIFTIGHGNRATGEFVALRNAGFRAYAGHMESDEFRKGIEQLVESAGARRVAIMCAERLPWQCHRNLIADSLVARGHTVHHLLRPGSGTEHALNRLARVDGRRLVYDVGAQLALGA